MQSPDTDATLYVDGEMISPSLGYVAETQCVALLVAYCRNVGMDIIVVEKESSQNVCSANTGIKLPECCFTSVSTQHRENIPECIQNCQLPAICTSDQGSVYSGLCTVLRYIVKRASIGVHSPSESAEVLQLLGHRMYCLKACSESSPRTKLCEVMMTSLVNKKLTEKTDSSSCDLIPDAILAFENLMSQDVVIHNMDKSQRILLNKLQGVKRPHPDEKSKRQRTGQKKVVWTKDLPPLEHAFAEGVDFTLSDICLLPCIHIYLSHCDIALLILKNLIPLTLKWYSRLQGVSKLKKAMSLCGVDFFDMADTDVLSNHSNEKETQIIELKTPVISDDTKEDKKKKKEIDLTVRRNLPKLLEKLESNNIHVSFAQFDSEELYVNWSKLPQQLHPTQGELKQLRAQRKCQQIENLLRGVKGVVKSGDRIVDFCSGGGHVGIVLAHMFPKCQVFLVENKEESLDRARARISALKLRNISVYQCNLEFFKGTFNVGVALHACGVASDMVIQKCISKNASFVISPCCYGKIRDSHWITYPQSKHFKGIPVTFKENLVLGHAADRTSWNFESNTAKQGKLCMGYVDLDRANAAREQGYDVSLYTMQPYSCTPKNNLLVGKAPEKVQG